MVFHYAKYSSVIYYLTKDVTECLQVRLYIYLQRCTVSAIL